MATSAFGQARLGIISAAFLALRTLTHGKKIRLYSICHDEFNIRDLSSALNEVMESCSCIGEPGNSPDSLQNRDKLRIAKTIVASQLEILRTLSERVEDDGISTDHIELTQFVAQLQLVKSRVEAGSKAEYAAAGMLEEKAA